MLKLDAKGIDISDLGHIVYNGIQYRAYISEQFDTDSLKLYLIRYSVDTQQPQQYYAQASGSLLMWYSFSEGGVAMPLLEIPRGMFGNEGMAIMLTLAKVFAETGIYKFPSEENVDVHKAIAEERDSIIKHERKLVERLVFGNDFIKPGPDRDFSVRMRSVSFSDKGRK